MPRELHLSAVFGMCLAWVTWGTLSAQEPSASPLPEASAFDSPSVQEWKLVVSEAAQDQLRTAPREYVECEWRAPGQAPIRVAIKLKGAAGSYRDWDDRPGLTVNAAKFNSQHRVFGMKKFHLNNAVQDETYLSEWLGAEFFRAVDVEVPRVGHVRLWINDRDMGLYVLREGFDSGFLRRRFGESKGRLYDGGFLQDIDSDLELDSGDADVPKSDLIALATACYARDFDDRQAAIAERLDIDGFLTFMAMERICGHWDGYSLNQNNYRIYFPSKGKAVFLPHGMDQLFGDPGAGLFDPSRSLVAEAVMQSDAWRGAYQERLRQLVSRIDAIEAWSETIDRMQDRLQGVLRPIDAELASVHEERVAELKERLAQRLEALPRLIEEVPTPIDFHAVEGEQVGVVALADWFPVIESEQVQCEVQDRDGAACYAIVHAGLGDGVASWRTQTLLARGVYRWTARIQMDSVLPIPEDPVGGVVIRSLPLVRPERWQGTHDWMEVAMEVAVTEDQRWVEWILEMRARHGSLWIDRDSIRLTQVRDE
jgi:hypothetical protein